MFKDTIIHALEKSIAEINANADKDMLTAKDKAVREQIIPFNQQLDKEFELADKALKDKLEQDVHIRKDKYNTDRQALVEASTKKKEDFYNSVISSVTYDITKERDKAVSKLQSQINELRG